MVEVHLYGKLRRFSDNQDPTRDSIIYIPVKDGDTIEDIVKCIGIPFAELGDNIFLNGRYFGLDRQVNDGDRLGLFPDNMQMIIV
ncbi:MAG: hypothetical protein ACE5KP_05435 [Dehalococcoidales bacterium]